MRPSIGTFALVHSLYGRHSRSTALFLVASKEAFSKTAPTLLFEHFSPATKATMNGVHGKFCINHCVSNTVADQDTIEAGKAHLATSSEVMFGSDSAFDVHGLIAMIISKAGT